MRQLTLIARVWRLPGLIAGAAVAVSLWRWLPAPVEVPGRAGGIEWVLTPVIPVVLALASIGPLRVAHETWERISARPVAHRRMAVVGAIQVVGVVACLLGLGCTPIAAQAARNFALLFGLTAAMVMLATPAVQWVPAVLFATASWLLGAPPIGHPAPAWALLLQPWGSGLAAAVTAVVAAAGLAAYLCCERPRR